LWNSVDQLIATKQPNRYDEAVTLLTDLRDLAGTKGGLSEFSERMAALALEHARRPSLLRRLRGAGLLDSPA
jgi:hypothetical protein